MLQAQVQGNARPHSVETQTSRARLLWIQDVQAGLSDEPKFLIWKDDTSLDFLYLDDERLWRCKGRMKNSDLSPSARHPILLNKHHFVTSLLVRDAHCRVMHNGTRETLAELRMNYWLVCGRQFVRKVIFKCSVCRRLEGKSFQRVPSPALPEFWVKQSRPFQHSGVDFAGPLFVKDLEKL